MWVPTSKILRIIWIVLIVFLFKSHQLHAQYNEGDIYGYNLVDLSKEHVKTATKIVQEYQYIPSTIHVINETDIKENAFFTLEEALASIPGFQFRNIQGFNSYVFQRGIPNQNNLMLVLIDGVQVNELNSGGFYGGAQYNLDNVERIEVVYGPSSVFYGTNAMSGVVNIITKDHDGASASLQMGGFNTKAANVNYGMKARELQFSISGMYKTSEKANLKEAAGDYNWSENMENFEDDYAIDLKMKYKGFAAEVNYMNKQASRTTNKPSVNTIYVDKGSRWNIVFSNIQLSYSKKINDYSQLVVKLYNRNSNVKNNTIGEVRDTTMVGYYRPNYMIGADAVFEYSRIKNMDLIVGFIAENEYLSNGFTNTYSNSSTELPEKPDKPDMIQNSLYSGVLNVKYGFFKDFSFVGGVRFDLSSYYNEVFTPQMAILYSHKSFLWKLHYGLAFRAPKPWDLTDGIGNQDLLPESLKSLEFSSSYQFSKRIRFTLSLYNNILFDSFQKKYINDLNEYYWHNEGEINTFGIEAKFEYSYEKLEMNANYTYNNSVDEQKNAIPEISKNTAYLGIKYRLNFPVIIAVQSLYYSKRESVTKSESIIEIDPVYVFNTTITVKYFRKLDIQFIGRNLLDYEYYHSSNTSVDRYRQAQRSLHLKITYKL